jgi:hypothetical protein
VKTPIFRQYISKSSVSTEICLRKTDISHISGVRYVNTLIYLSCVLIHIRPLYMMQTTNIRKRMLEKNYIHELESALKNDSGSAVKNLFTSMELECTLPFS